jgi:hypothetical protein
VELGPPLPDDRAPDLEVLREQALRLGLRVAAGTPHRRRVRSEHDARAAGELRDDLGQQAQGVGPYLDRAHAYGGQLPFRIGECEGPAQAGEVGGVRPLEPAGDRHRTPKAVTCYAFLCSVVTV